MNKDDVLHLLDQLIADLDSLKDFKLARLKRGNRPQLPGMIGTLFTLAAQRKEDNRLVRLGDAMVVLGAAFDEIVFREVDELNATLANTLASLLPFDVVTTMQTLNLIAEHFGVFIGESKRIATALANGDVWTLIYELVKNAFVVATVSDLGMKSKYLIELRTKLIDDLLSSTALLDQPAATRHVRFKGSRKKR